MIDLVIHWDINPEAFSIGPLTLRWYGIFWGCAFFAGFHAFRELLKFDKPARSFRAKHDVQHGTIVECSVHNHWDYFSNNQPTARKNRTFTADRKCHKADSSDRYKATSKQKGKPKESRQHSQAETE